MSADQVWPLCSILGIGLLVLVWFWPRNDRLPFGQVEADRDHPWAAVVFRQDEDAPGLRRFRWHRSEEDARRWAVTVAGRLSRRFPKHRIGWSVSRRHPTA